MTLATIVNRLKAEGTITQVRVNRYRVNDTIRATALEVNREPLYTLSQIHSLFAELVSPGNYRFKMPTYRSRVESTTPPPAQTATPSELRRIRRGAYHSTGSGETRLGVGDALAAIPLDSDGVRRSFGFEWEINALSPVQEDALARLLDTLPTHVAERDGSLSSTGVDLVFMPMSKATLIRTFKTLQSFCRDNNVDMDRTGAHLTYGVSNSSVVRVQDLQVRLNRVALAVKACAIKRNIEKVFGRDFTGYAHLPSDTTTSDHSNAWNASRGTDAYELRLCSWRGDIEKIVEFVIATESVFQRPFNRSDFLRIFDIMGQTCLGV